MTKLWLLFCVRSRCPLLIKGCSHWERSSLCHVFTVTCLYLSLSTRHILEIRRSNCYFQRSPSSVSSRSLRHSWYSCWVTMIVQHVEAVLLCFAFRIYNSLKCIFQIWAVKYSSDEIKRNIPGNKSRSVLFVCFAQVYVGKWEQFKTMARIILSSKYIQNIRDRDMLRVKDAYAI